LCKNSAIRDDIPCGLFDVFGVSIVLACSPLDAGSWDMGETHAFRRRPERFGLDNVPTPVARTVRETGIAATQLKCAPPSHEPTTSIPHEGFLIAGPLRDSPVRGGPQASIPSPEQARLMR
jgi:hypothetical protein